MENIEYDRGGVRTFLADRVRRDPVAEIVAKDLHAEYVAWMASTGRTDWTLSSVAFGRAVAKNGIATRRTKHGMVYLGITTR